MTAHPQVVEAVDAHFEGGTTFDSGSLGIVHPTAQSDSRGQSDSQIERQETLPWREHVSHGVYAETQRLDRRYAVQTNSAVQEPV